MYSVTSRKLGGGDVEVTQLRLSFVCFLRSTFDFWRLHLCSKLTKKEFICEGLAEQKRERVLYSCKLSFATEFIFFSDSNSNQRISSAFFVEGTTTVALTSGKPPGSTQWINSLQSM